MKHRRRTSRPSAPRARSGGGVILGIFVGMVLGASIVAFAVWFFNRTDNPFSQTNPTRQQVVPPDQGQTTPQTPPVAALPGKPGDRPVEKPDFTFFNVLPKGENAPATLPAPPAGQPASAPPPLPAPVQSTPAKQMFLQLAAFENAEQADDLKAQLLLMGLDPITQRAQLQDGRVVHRIRIGPFANREDLKAMRARLSSSGLSSDEVSN